MKPITAMWGLTKFEPRFYDGSDESSCNLFLISKVKNNTNSKKFCRYIKPHQRRRTWEHLPTSWKLSRHSIERARVTSRPQSYGTFSARLVSKQSSIYRIYQQELWNPLLNHLGLRIRLSHTHSGGSRGGPQGAMAPPPNDGQIFFHTQLYKSLIDFLNNETHKNCLNRYFNN